MDQCLDQQANKAGKMGCFEDNLGFRALAGMSLHLTPAQISYQKPSKRADADLLDENTNIP